MFFLIYYFRHALIHLTRDKSERQRTALVLFCIAAGVAAIVSLHTIGQMMQAALLSNLQSANRSDIAISMPPSLSPNWKATLPDGTEARVDHSLFNDQDENSIFGASVTLSPIGERRLLNWAARNGFDMQMLWSNNGPYTPARAARGSTQTTYIMVMGVDPSQYPYYGEILTEQPAGLSLSQVLEKPRDAAITTTVAQRLGIGVGDSLYISGVSRPYTVTAIISPNSEANTPTLISTSIFPFAYIPYSTVIRDFHISATTYYVRLPPGTDVQAAKRDLLTHFPGFIARTTEDLSEVNKTFSEIMTRLVTMMGLVSLLIGGIGIANTMTVVVRHRSLEIAVLKTIGVQGSQIIWMFITEALLLGVTGSGIGLVLGQLLVGTLKDFGEQFIYTPMNNRLYGESLGIGFGLGVLVTLVFGFLPILTAARVRPQAVLRPQESLLPPAGCLSTLLVLATMTAILGMVVGRILGSLLAGIIAAYVTMVVLAVATLLIDGIIWLVCRLPSFGILLLRLSQRSLNATRSRAANTLLALIVGIFGLGSVWLFVQGTLKITSGESSESILGGNILVVVQSLSESRRLEREMRSQDAILSYAHDAKYMAKVVAINGQPIKTAIEEAKQRARDANIIGADGPIESIAESFTIKVRKDDTLPYTIARGRDLAAPDEIVLDSALSYGQIYQWYELHPGDSLTLKFASGARRTVRVAGITPTNNSGGFVLAAMVDFRATHGIVQPGLLPAGLDPLPSVYVLSVPDESVNEAMDFLANRPGVYMVDVRQFNDYADQVLSRFVPLPLTAAWLVLFASAVIIANTVSLSTLERRREVAIMKAIGLQTESVLGLLLLENGLVGLLGGLLGTGLSLVVVVSSGALGDQAADVPTGALGWLVALAVVLSLVATMLTAWNAAQEKPLNVLRYE